MKNKEVFTTQDENGNDIELAVIAPSAKVNSEASLVHAASWAQAARPLRDKDGKVIRLAAPLRVEIEKHILPEHEGIWSSVQEEEYKDLQTKLLHSQQRLAAGGNAFSSLNEAVTLAWEMKRDRASLNQLVMKRVSLDDNSAENFAEMARLHYLIYSCTVYNLSNKPFYNSLDEYYNRTNEKATLDASTQMLQLLNGTSLDFVNKTPENEFLRDYGYLNDKYRRINSKGELVDDDGRLVNDKGEWIDTLGNLVDREGKPINEEGEYIIEFKPFVDSEGNVIPKKR